MKKQALLLCALFVFGTAAKSQEKIPETLVREAKASIQRGVNFLTDKQKEDGSWADHPAVTALACMALHNSEASLNPQIRKEAVEKGRQYLLKHAQEDGSIWQAEKEKGYPNYTTSVAVCALAVINNPKDIPVLRKARAFIKGQQVDEDYDAMPTQKDNPFYGGIGYGSAGPGRPDLSNTQWALEALYLTEHLDKEPHSKDPEDAKSSKLAWQKAATFLARLQHLPESNDQQWVVEDPDSPERGGFIYKPGDSKVSSKLEDQETLRSYGSMTYAGLKSMIYAKFPKDSPQIKSAVEWASKHYTLDENPEMGPEGHYYYLHTFAKANSVIGHDYIESPDRKKHLWRVDLIKKLLELQKSDGEWYNDKHGRWWESVPELVTAYSLLAMETALGPQL